MKNDEITKNDIDVAVEEIEENELYFSTAINLFEDKRRRLQSLMHEVNMIGEQGDNIIWSQHVRYKKTAMRKRINAMIIFLTDIKEIW